MKLILLLSVVVLTGCQGADPRDSIILASSDNPQNLPAFPNVEPSPNVDSQVPPAKGLFSVWSRIDDRYTVDLSELTDLDSSSAIIVVDNVVWFDFGNVNCGSKIQINGTQLSGTLSITTSNSGSASGNAEYCNALKGTYQYVATSDGYRLEKEGVLTYWK